eukprot:4006935-Alexandrium_andersonii.AAC.1
MPRMTLSGTVRGCQACGVPVHSVQRLSLTEARSWRKAFRRWSLCVAAAPPSRSSHRSTAMRVHAAVGARPAW